MWAKFAVNGSQLGNFGLPAIAVTTWGTTLFIESQPEFWFFAHELRGQQSKSLFLNQVR